MFAVHADGEGAQVHSLHLTFSAIHSAGEIITASETERGGKRLRQVKIILLEVA